ncbi:MAG TPA: CPBP family intramembrane metalloprotease [Kiritimatiellae bacterium]|nr:CPBP family intramembrane metalloprotease [Kiritimatiellia bacterium]
MMMSCRKRQGERRSGFGAVILWFSAAVLMGGLAAPWVWSLAIFLGRSFPALSFLRDTELTATASRCVLLAVLLLMTPVVRWAGLGGIPLLWGPWTRGAWRQGGGGWISGATASAAVAAVGVAVGAYTVRAGRAVGAEFLLRLGGFLLAGIAVAVIEETIFRGGMYRLLRGSHGFQIAALVSSLVYSAVHFAKPWPPVMPVNADWLAGLKLLQYMFGEPWRWHDGFMFLTIFFLGVFLCATYEATGRLYLPAGAHAGIVFVMKVVRFLLDRDRTVAPVLFGPSAGIVKAPAATIMAVLLAAGVVGVLRFSHAPSGRNAGASLSS